MKTEIEQSDLELLQQQAALVEVYVNIESLQNQLQYWYQQKSVLTVDIQKRMQTQVDAKKQEEQTLAADGEAATQQPEQVSNDVPAV